MDENDKLWKKMDRLKEVNKIYKEALLTYARRFPEKNNMNAAELALDKAKKIEPLLG